MVIGAVYFVCFIIIGAFVNMIVGVTVTNLQVPLAYTLAPAWARPHSAPHFPLPAPT